MDLKLQSLLKNLILVRLKFWKIILWRLPLSITQKLKLSSMHSRDRKYQSSNLKLNIPSLNQDKNFNLMSFAMQMMLPSSTTSSTLWLKTERTRISFSKPRGSAQQSTATITCRNSISEIFTPSRQQLKRYSFKTEEEKVRKSPGRERSWLIKRNQRKSKKKNKMKSYSLSTLKPKQSLQNMDATSSL